MVWARVLGVRRRRLRVLGWPGVRVCPGLLVGLGWVRLGLGLRSGFRLGMVWVSGLSLGLRW